MINDRVNAALDMVGLRDLAERRPSQLSGGQQQRIALARTIVIEPKVLLLDEPLSNLDANLRIQMRREIRELQRKLKLTTIFVTHDQEEANTTADRMAVLDQGVIQQVGTPLELYDKPENLFVATFLGTANVIEGAVMVDEGAAFFQSVNGLRIPVGNGQTEARHLVFRPQNVSVAKSDTGLQGENGHLSGTVSHREFLGSVIRYSVQAGADTILIDDPHQGGGFMFEPGDRVRMSVDSDQATLLN